MCVSVLHLLLDYDLHKEVGSRNERIPSIPVRWFDRSKHVDKYFINTSRKAIFGTVCLIPGVLFFHFLTFRYDLWIDYI